LAITGTEEGEPGEEGRPTRGGERGPGAEGLPGGAPEAQGRVQPGPPVAGLRTVVVPAARGGRGVSPHAVSADADLGAGQGRDAHRAGRRPVEALVRVRR